MRLRPKSRFAGELEQQANDRLDETAVGINAAGLADARPIGTFTVELGTVPIRPNLDQIDWDAYVKNPLYKGIDGSGVTIAILDTGIDQSHAAFAGGRIAYQYDFVNGDRIAEDDHGHGTHVASIAGGFEAGMYAGVATGVKFVVLKVLGGDGAGSDASITSALNWVVANAAKYNIAAVNMSLGGGSNSPFDHHGYMTGALKSLYDKGVVSVGAAGNSYERYQSEGVDYPGSDLYSWAIGAVHSTGQYTEKLASFSQRSSLAMDMTAPGVDVSGARAGGGYVGMSGTSMAAPAVAGAVALAQNLPLAISGSKLDVETVRILMRVGAATITDDEIDDGVVNTGKQYLRLDIDGMLDKIVEFFRTGTSGADRLWGWRGDDLLSCGAGDDVVSGGEGADTLDGGDGIDLAVFDTLAYSATAIVRNGDGTCWVGGDLLRSIERIKFSDGLIRSLDDPSAPISDPGKPGPEPKPEPQPNPDPQPAPQPKPEPQPQPAPDPKPDPGLPDGRVSSFQVGSNGADRLAGGRGQDTLLGLGGDDFLEGGAGADDLFGGQGDDTLSGEEGGDLLDGGDGIDLALFADLDFTAVKVRKNADGSYTVGDDVLRDVEAVRFADGVVRDLASLVRGEKPDAPSTKPTSGNDDLNGTANADRISGRGGDDTIHGFDGDDRLSGNAGDDVLDGGGGHDRLAGGAGDDDLYGGAGDDMLQAGLGDDRLYGGEGIDTAIFADWRRGADIDLSAGEAAAADGATAELVDIEHVVGTRGDDSIAGDTRANSLSGGAGDDIIEGGAGDDTLLGGTGQDLLTGGEGADRFVFQSRWGDDTVTDFDASDVLDLSGVRGLSSFAQLVVQDADGAGIEIAFGRSKLLLEGLSMVEWDQMRAADHILI